MSSIYRGFLWLFQRYSNSFAQNLDIRNINTADGSINAHQNRVPATLKSYKFFSFRGISKVFD